MCKVRRKPSTEEVQSKCSYYCYYYHSYPYYYSFNEQNAVPALQEFRDSGKKKTVKLHRTIAGCDRSREKGAPEKPENKLVSTS